MFLAGSLCSFLYFSLFLLQVQTLNPRSGRSASMSSGTSTQAPTSKPPTPPTVRACGTLGRSQGASHYRTPAPPVAPPSVPSHYAPNYAMQGGGGGGGRGSGGGRGGRDGSGYAATSAVMSGGQGQTAPPVGMTRPMPTPQTASGGHTPSSPNMAQGIHIPPQMLPQGAIGRNLCFLMQIFFNLAIIFTLYSF